MDTWNLHSLRLAVAGSSQNSSDAAGKPLPSGEPDFQCSEDLPALFKTPQQLKSFKIEFVPLQSGPYSDINVPFQKALQHGSNTYSTLSTADQDIIFDALKQKCHSSSQLRRHRFVLLGDNYQGIRLPAGIMLQDFLPSRPRSDSAPKRRAVAIDCEMVGIEAPIATEKHYQNQARPGFEGKNHFNGSPPSLNQPIRQKNNRTPNGGLGKLAPRRTETSEIAYICAVDLLTGEVLINKFVQPPGKVTNWRTKYSGITSRALREAKSRRNCLASWRAARAELWKYVDADTVLIGHGLEHDLHALRVVHTRIVDTSLQTAEAVFGGVESFRRVWGLKDLMKQLVEIDIQNHGRQGHDCVEDTLATRELALWCVQNPRRLEAWGSERRDNMEKQGIERDRARTEGQRERGKIAAEIAHRS
ncbi:hypothetical protein PoMZ_13679 [Pyricularia oryzae]|uniref:Exonuclease domain-containing protein n=1 Tax=Pyricularia oryzae TaxID=318829 RepID=A0A4P7NVN8_PYROR|nr:hypothetical protein PoMZ_13679 [Pyricularia oryzae]